MGATSTFLEVLTAAVGIIGVATGIVFHFRPGTSYLLGVSAGALVAAPNVVADLTGPRPLASSRISIAALWILVGGLTTLYAYNCHRPIYGSPKPHDR